MLKRIVLLIPVICIAASLIINVNSAEDRLIYSKKENSSMKIALTFDDGPHPKYTRQILDILDKYGVKATFFTVGENAELYPETFLDVVSRGHEIGNHTYTHSHIFGMNATTLKKEMEKCEDAVYQLTEQKTKLFRPPEGYINNEVKKVARDLDYSVILWDIDTLDWAHNPPENIAKVVIDNIKSGDIILMHDYNSYGTPTPEALELILPVLLDEGYNFVVVSELIGAN